MARNEAAYCRQSIDKKDSISIETQIEFCLKESSNPALVRIYADKGYSGSNIERPDFKRLLSDIKAGLISKVIIYRLDRMSRSLLDFASLIQLFKRYDVEFQSTQEKFDTSTPIGNAMLSITMVFAQLERETIQQRIKDNYYSRGKQGRYLGGKAVYGFTLGKILLPDGSGAKALFVDEEKTEVVKKIFEMYGLEGMSLGEIARHLNNFQIPSANNVKWDSSKISRMLRSPTYVKSDVSIYHYYKAKGCVMENDVAEYNSGNGCFLYGKRETHERKYTNVKNHHVSLALHEGIIDAALFLKVQYKLDANKQLDNSLRGKHTWLTGLAKCEHCGYSLVVRTSNQSKYRYWYCSGRASGFCDDGVNHVAISATEEVVKRKIFEVAERNKDIIAVKEKEINKEKNDLLVKIETIDAKIENLLKSLMNGDEISQKYIHNKISDLDKQKQSLQKQMDKIMFDDRYTVKPKQMGDIIGDWDSLSNSQKKEVAALFIDKVMIGENTVEIYWKYHFGNQGETCY